MASYYTTDDDLFLVQHYPTAPREWICEVMDRSWASVKYRATSHLGLSRPNIRTSQLLPLLEESPTNCYWWGFITADGHITDKGNLKVKLQQSDTAFLEKLADHIGCETRQEGNMIVIERMDRINGLALKDLLGFKKRKTYNPPDNTRFLTTPDSLLAFLLGVIDGDGCITYRKGRFQSIRVEVHGSWMGFFEELMGRISDSSGIGSTVTKTTRGTTSVYLGKNATFEALKRFSDLHSLPTMERKWKKHEQDT